MKVLAVRAGFQHVKQHEALIRREVPLFHELKRLGVELTVVLVPDQTDFASILRAEGISALSLNVPAGANIMRLASVLASARLLRTQIRVIGPDIIDAAGPLRTIVSVLANSRLQAKVAYRRHHEQGSKALDLSSRLAARGSDCVLVSCNGLRDVAVVQDRVKETKVAITRSGMSDLRQLAAGSALATRAKYGLDPSESLVVGIGRLTVDKGFDVLIRSAAALKTPVRVAIIGEGQELERLKSLAEGLGVDTIFPGYQAEIVPWIMAADVIVQPSRREGYCRVVVEAMSLSKPVVGSAVGGLLDSIRHRETGLLVAPNDAVALARAIAEILSDRPLAEQLGQAARQGYEREHTIQNMAESWHRAWIGMAKL